MLFYRIILVLAAPILCAHLLIRWLRGLETRSGIAQRLGFGARPGARATRIWLHGASLGELISARPLIDQMLVRHRGLHVVVTANTYTGRELVRGWDHAQIDARLAPLDYPACVRRFLADFRPIAMVTLENELWPVRFAACARAGVAVLVLGGRMSARSAALWARFGGISAHVMNAVTGLWPLDAQNAARFVRLGLPAASMREPTNLKSGVDILPPAPDQLTRFLRIWPRETTILAASVHTGEADVILAAFATALRARPDLRLIMAPRHPPRADAIARLIKTRALKYSRRTLAPEPALDDAVFLADTIGEMALWYSAAAITVVGGSFTDKGGHTPFEPVQFASVVVHGPDITNHAQAYAALHRVDAAHTVGDADALAKTLIRLAAAKSHDDQNAHAAQALAQIRKDQALPESLLACLDTLIANHN